MRRLYEVIAFGALVLGSASLALTGYLWLGDWPQRTKELVDYQRSAAENAGRPPQPLVYGASTRAGESLAGTWPAVIDPYGRGALAGIAPRDVRPETPSDLAEFSFDDGLEL